MFVQDVVTDADVDRDRDPEPDRCGQDAHVLVRERTVEDLLWKLLIP